MLLSSEGVPARRSSEFPGSTLPKIKRSREKGSTSVLFIASVPSSVATMIAW